ncbi:TetR family transcriptional regulator [Gordonia sihwensis]|uniref:Putative TetR family transcriptional regulator n=1 Tax=Gordonia sihwensis NBRC 108236 TaxID=1223544 RepID=L7LPY4_9ACTN|nr:TetR family transcriptional regulator [Gordonia sihwensis]GAC62816.1 putative TetR family transcriptional regulator [Gordonia sihwensis NBRC 108236]
MWGAAVDTVNVVDDPSTRARLVAAGVDLVDTAGFGAVGVRSVAARAGVSHGAPRRYFPTLESLLAAIAAEGVADLNAALAPAVANGIGDGAVAYWRFARARPGMFTLIFRHDLLDSAGGRLRETTGGWFSALVEATGDELRAVSCWAAVHGLCVLAATRAPEAFGFEIDESVVRRVAEDRAGG